MTESSDKRTIVRRDFIHVAAGAFAGTGILAATWPFIDSLNPAADVRALATVEIDLAPIDVGQRITIKWQGRPVFIARRTEAEIRSAVQDDEVFMLDKAPDITRVERPEWLVVIGICTHLGCVPLGQSVQSDRGEWNGWFCPCHGSHYDTSGRIRKGPAPRNLDIPPYRFVTETVLKIG